MPTKRTIKAEAVSQPEVVAPLTVKAVKASKATKAAATSPAVKTGAPAAPAKASTRGAVSKAKAGKPASKSTKAQAAPAASESPLAHVSTEAPAASGAIIATHSVPTEAISLAALSDEISRVAYQLWIDGGCQHGRALDDWSRAEGLVKSRYGL